MSLLDAFLLEPAPFEVWIAHRTDGIKGTGTQSDPFNGSTQALLDGILSTLPTNVALRVHLGPSPKNSSGVILPFITAGFWMSDGAGTTLGLAWTPRPGMTLTGAGMEATRLQLAPGTTAHYHYFAIGAPTTSPVDYLEVSNMTIDANLPSSGSVACGAIRVMGNHVRVRNVKCIGWGSRTTAQPAFVVALLVGDPDSGSTMTSADDAVIEDCVAMSPSANNTVAGAVVNVLHIGGRERAAVNALTQYGRGPVIRNCFVDCGSPAPASPSPEYRALSMGACKGGVVEGNQVHNVNIGGPYQERQSTADIIVRNNTYRNVVTGPFWKMGGIVTAYGSGSVSRSGTVLTVSVTSIAGLQVGDRVKLVTNPTAFSGVYVVKTVHATLPQFTVATAEPTVTSASLTSADKLFGAGRIVFEGNHLELAVGLSGISGVKIEDGNTTSYVEAPDYVIGDLYVRNNKTRYVDGAAPAGTGDLAFTIKGTRWLTVANNVVDSANARPMENQRCGFAKYSVGQFDDTPPGRCEFGRQFFPHAKSAKVAKGCSPSPKAPSVAC